MTTVGTLGPPRPAKGRAVEDVERSRAPRQADRIPERVTNDARSAPGASERKKREFEIGASAKRAEQPADVTSRAGSRLDQWRRVDPDPHEASVRSAAGRRP